MPYVQVWLKVPDAQTLLETGPSPDEPIKRPCHPATLADPLPRSPADDLRKLGADQVVSPTPAFFVDDETVWARLAAHAQHVGDGTIVTSLKTAVDQLPSPS